MHPGRSSASSSTSPAGRSRPASRPRGGISEIELSTTLGDTNDRVVVSGTAGNDSIFPSADGLRFNGGAAVDVTFSPALYELEFDGFGGNDKLDARDYGPFFTGPIWAYGGEGDDNLTGNTGNDVFEGGPGTDLLEPMEGNDIVDGGDGIDTIRGHGGDDTITGGPGRRRHDRQRRRRHLLRSRRHRRHLDQRRRRHRHRVLRPRARPESERDGDQDRLRRPAAAPASSAASTATTSATSSASATSSTSATSTPAASASAAAGSVRLHVRRGDADARRLGRGGPSDASSSQRGQHAGVGTIEWTPSGAISARSARTRPARRRLRTRHGENTDVFEVVGQPDGQRTGQSTSVSSTGRPTRPTGARTDSSFIGSGIEFRIELRA